MNIANNSDRPPRTSPIPYACPICHGLGCVSRPPEIPGDLSFWNASNAISYTCPACIGTGIVWRKHDQPDNHDPDRRR